MERGSVTLVDPAKEEKKTIRSDESIVEPSLRLGENEGSHTRNESVVASITQKIGTNQSISHAITESKLNSGTSIL